jgi:hypothetical protein
MERPEGLSIAVRIVAVFLALGALWGIGAPVWQGSLFGAGPGPSVRVAVHVSLLSVAPFVLAVAAAALLLKSPNRLAALLPAGAVLAAQCVRLHFENGFGYAFTCGAGVNVGISGSGDLLVGATLGSALEVGAAAGEGSLRINLVAVMALALLIAHARWLDEPEAPVGVAKRVG